MLACLGVEGKLFSLISAGYCSHKEIVEVLCCDVHSVNISLGTIWVGNEEQVQIDFRSTCIVLAMVGSSANFLATVSVLFWSSFSDSVPHARPRQVRADGLHFVKLSWKRWTSSP